MPDDHDERKQRHARLSAALAALSDAQIEALAGAAEGAESGIGGHTGTVTVGGEPVFVKLVPLTALELAHPGSTANLFGLPMFYHYGVGSAGFGAWRELAAHTMTTEWVLDGAYDGFPLTYHWRVLPHSPAPVDDVDFWVAHWEGSPAVRARLEALAAAPAVLAVFLERVPYTLDSWLRQNRDPANIEWADAELGRGVTFLRERGLLHLDAHFRNLLTDGRRVYFADFGLALHEGFELDATEAAFLERHRGYDRAYTVTHLNQWLVIDRLGISWHEFDQHLGEVPERDRAITTTVARWWRAMETTSRATPYPHAEVSFGGRPAG